MTQQKGWTLIELAIVCVLLAILSIVYLISLPSFSVFSLSEAGDLLARDLRYTQSLAMGMDQNYSLVTTAKSYSISPIPPTGSYTVRLANGLSMTVTTVTFTPSGAPSAAASITITGGSNTRTLTVAAQTGYVNG